MTRILIALLLIMLAGPACAGERTKFIAVDSTGVVQDIATVKGNLSRVYQFEAKPTIYEVPESLDVDILDKYDGVRVTSYPGTDTQRRLELLSHAITKITEIIATLTTRDPKRVEYEAVKTELLAMQEALQ